ncbi:MAG: hypothetical protein KAR20_18830, partial [Candidatus Heimdallarchaeota archaeon]|nr:hypothetical protein [Candidatus Heimdallarchaeota archaeon]
MSVPTFTKPAENQIRIASFDIGKKNFAQYTEDADKDVLLRLEIEYSALPKKLQRRVGGAINSRIEEMITSICLAGKRIQTGVYDLRDDKTSDKLDMQTRKNILGHLERYNGLWSTCDIFIIEQQYFKTWGGRGKRSAGTEANVDAIKIAECVLMWLLNEYPFRTVMYFGSQNKTQILGAPWKMTKTQRKKWAEVKSRDIYESRGDYGMTELFALNDRIFKKRLTTEAKIKVHLDSFPIKSPLDDSRVLAEKIVRARQK